MKSFGRKSCCSSLTSRLVTLTTSAGKKRACSGSYTVSLRTFLFEFVPCPTMSTAGGDLGGMGEGVCVGGHSRHSRACSSIAPLLLFVCPPTYSNEGFKSSSFACSFDDSCAFHLKLWA
jgi:hypothetical protein